MKKRYTPEEKNNILNLINEGFSTKQISEKTSFTTRQITIFKNYRKIKTRNFPLINITKEQEQIILGSLLGDGCIDVFNKKYNYSRLVIKHCIKQLEYVEYKKSFLENLSYRISILNRFDIRFKIPNYLAVELKTKTLSLFENYRKTWYPVDKKIVPDEVYNLEPLGLAIWYMDDGFYGKGSGLCIATQGFEKKYVIKLQNLLKQKWNIDSIVRKNNVIYIRAISRKLFLDLVTPYMCKSMIYKLSPQ